MNPVLWFVVLIVQVGGRLVLVVHVVSEGLAKRLGRVTRGEVTQAFKLVHDLHIQQERRRRLCPSDYAIDIARTWHEPIIPVAHTHRNGDILGLPTVR